MALTFKLLPKGTLPLHARPRPPPLTLPFHQPALLHFFLAELTVCPIPCLTRPLTRPFSGTNSQGILSGFNKTVLRTLPRSRNLIVVESVLMAMAFLAMLLVRPGTGSGQPGSGDRGREKGARFGRVAGCLEAWSEPGARAESWGGSLSLGAGLEARRRG